MSVPGRKPTPKHLKLVRNNPGKRADPPAYVPASPDDKPRMPVGLNDDEKTIWRRVMRNAPLGLLRAVDAELLLQWVRARALYDEASEKLRGSAMLIKTPNGMPAQSPFLAIINRQSELMRKIGSELGFSPVARTRLGVSDDEPPETNDYFG